MPPLRPDAQPIDQEGRLLLLVKRRRMAAQQAKQLASLAREAGEPLPSMPRATAAGDASKLRGVPILGRGVDGAIRGSRPGYDPLNRRLWGRSATEILVTTPAAVPGSEPEAELLANHGDWPRSFDGRAEPADSVS